MDIDLRDGFKGCMNRKMGGVEIELRTCFNMKGSLS
jgi:hypothetical protein